MFDIELIKEILNQILVTTRSIEKRSKPILSAEDFTNSEAGLEKLDAICMQLIAIGESIKHLDKITGGTFLQNYHQVEWKRIMGMRDILTHHYFDLDAEIVYTVCTQHIRILEQTIEIILLDLSRK